MDFKHRRGNYLIIFEKVIELPILILGALASIILVKNFDAQAVMPLVFILFSPISRLISYLFTFYTLEEDHLLVESGVFTKQRVEIPFSTITTVDLSQNILFQLFKVYKIKVDNASQTNDTANKSNIVLTLKIDQAIQFKEVLTKGKNTQEIKEQEAETDAIKAMPQDFVKLGLLQSKWVYFLSIIAVAGPFLGIIAPKLENIFQDMLIGGLIAAAIILGYVLSVALSLGKSVLTYYNFKVWATDDTVKIKYGLLNKKSFSLQKSKINGIIFKQNLLMRLCGFYTAEVIVIGYGDADKEGETERAIIFPLATLERLKKIVGRLLPEYSVEYTLCHPDRGAVRYFFVNPGFISALITAAISVMVSIAIGQPLIAAAATVLLILAVIDVLLRFKNSGISVGNKNVVLSSGGFSRWMAFIKTVSIESVTSKGSMFKRERGYVSISLGYVAPARAARLTSYNLPADQFEQLQSVLKY